MAFVRQRAKTDCGVAALAMLCDVSYEEVYRVIPWRKHGIMYGTDTKMLRTAAERLGYEGRGTLKQQLKRMGASIDWRDIPDNSLVKVPHPTLSMWHWVAWRRGKIYDPARGVFSPEKIGLRPSAYMEFTKGNDHD